MLILALVVALKLASQLLSSILPGALVEQGASAQYVSHVFEPAFDTATLFVTLALSVGYSALVRSSTPSRTAGLVAVAALTTVMAVLTLQPMQSYSVLLALFVVAGASLWVIGQIALAVAVSRDSGLARYRLLGTVGGQALSLAVLLWPALASRAWLLLLAALVAVALAASLSMNDSATAERPIKAPSTLPVTLVAPGAALLFVAVALVGLNGEQIIDARLKLSLRAAHALGVRGPMIVSHAVTIAARLAAYASSGPGAPLSPLAMAAVWQGAQILRVVVLGISDVRALPLPVTAALIALDKWSGSLGEIALEAALLHFLATHSVVGAHRGGNAAALAVTGVFLMGLMGPLEAVTGSLAKVVARSAAVSGPAVLLLTVVPVLAVWRWTRKTV